MSTLQNDPNALVSPDCMQARLQAHADDRAANAKFVADVFAMCERGRVPHAASHIAINAVDMEEAKRMLDEAQNRQLQKMVDEEEAAEREGRPVRHIGPF